MRRYLIFLKAFPESYDHITSEIGYLFHGHQNWIQFSAEHAVNQYLCEIFESFAVRLSAINP